MNLCPKVGRKPAITDDVIQRLITAFKYGHNNKTACQFAGISQDTFYTYMRKNSEFSEKVTVAKAHIKILAATAVCRAIMQGNVRVAMWYLERKEPEQFAKRKIVSAF